MNSRTFGFFPGRHLAEIINYIGCQGNSFRNFFLSDSFDSQGKMNQLTTFLLDLPSIYQEGNLSCLVRL